MKKRRWWNSSDTALLANEAKTMTVAQFSDKYQMTQSTVRKYASMNNIKMVGYAPNNQQHVSDRKMCVSRDFYDLAMSDVKMSRLEICDSLARKYKCSPRTIMRYINSSGVVFLVKRVQNERP